MDRLQREQIARDVLANSSVGEIEVLVSSSDEALTRFTHEVSNQNVFAEDVEISVRVIIDGRIGVASANTFDALSLQQLVERATMMARLSPQDLLQPPLPVGKPALASPDAYDRATALSTLERRTQMCDALFSAAENGKCWSAGFVSTSATGVTIANSNGAFSSFDGTDASVNVKMIAADSSGWAEAHTNNVGTIDAHAIAHRAVMKARNSATPETVTPGTWTVILEPAAFGEMLSHLLDHFSAQSYDEGSSFCSDGLEREYFGKNVSIYDDYAHPLDPGMPFDFEGYPTQRLALVERGIVKNIVTDSYYAHKLHRENTGHALPAPNEDGPQPLHVVVAPGSNSTQELIAQTKRGLLVTRFWYTRPVDEKQVVITGMTRDGTFLIENGRITRGVRNMRFNQSILTALRSCTFSSDLQRTATDEYSMIVPAVRIDEFEFTSGTDF